MSGPSNKIGKADYAFYCRYFEHVRDPRRHFQLNRQDLLLLNPNTKTCPIFRSSPDAALNKKVYSHVPILVNDSTLENPWGTSFLRMFDMSNDSDLFCGEAAAGLLPLYEGKMVQAYDHRAASVLFMAQNKIRQNQPEQTTPEQYANPSYAPKPLWWVPSKEVESRLPNWKYRWLIGFKDVTASTNERTSIFAILPRVGVGHTVPLMIPGVISPPAIACCLLANMNSIPFDYLIRQKIGGLHLTYNYIKQIPVLPPQSFSDCDISFISSRVAQLVYTSHDMKDFAEDMGFKGEVVRWNDAQRAQLRAELDAYYIHLYGLTRKELNFLLDPKDVFGTDFPSETFRVLREDEEKQLGEYRTQRLVLAAFEELSASDRFLGEKRECTITGTTWTVGD